MLIILAILLPPLAVYLDKEKIGKDFWINILLCIFFYVPGIIHALWVIL